MPHAPQIDARQRIPPDAPGHSTHHSETVTSPPLVVDLDGTLTHSDTLIESALQVARQAPLNLLRMPVWLAGGRASFKRAIAARTDASRLVLPYRTDLIEYIRSQRTAGRRVVLATAAHRSVADRVAGELGLFDQVLATGDGINLKGEAKLAAIRAEIGPDFVYAGDSRADLPIWHAAKAVVLAGVSESTRAALHRHTPVERDFPNPARGPLLWLRALRLHQWTKNLLLFVPLLTAFSFADPHRLQAAITAFFAFSFAASATYIGNDLLDLDNDRRHPRKRNRPFASGHLPITQGVVVAVSALMGGLALAAAVSGPFVLMLMLYLAITSAYSWVLKRYVLLDVLMLSLLYTLRILAGAVSVGLATSSWLLVFSAFIFLSLALVKRCAELALLLQNGETATRGRDYRVSDLVVLWPMGVGAALCSVIVFGLFISAADTRARYLSPDLLWLVEAALIYWLGRLWIKTARNEMHDDPVVYALRDRGSRLVIAFMVAVVLCAHALPGWALTPASPEGRATGALSSHVR